MTMTDSKPSSATREEVLPHIFLPLQLPGELGDIVEYEGEMLRLVTDVINHLLPPSSSEDKEDILKDLKHTFNTWESLQTQEHLDAKYVQKAIRCLSPGDEFALYIREQNAGLLITMLDANESKSNGNGNSSNGNNGSGDGHYTKTHTIFSTFPACQPTDLVTSSKGDLAAIFPMTSISLPSTELLSSKCFARQLSALSIRQTPQCMASITKAGLSTIEVREVSNPTFVSQWLTALLADEHSKQAPAHQIPRIMKKIRDRIIYDKGPLPFRRSGMWMTIKVILQLCLTRQFGEVNGTFCYKLIMLRLMLKLVNNSSIKDLSLIMHMIGKIARRALKLDLYYKAHCTLPEHLTHLFQDVTAESARILQKVRNTLKDDWDDLIKKEIKNSSLAPVYGNLETNLSLKHNGLNEYLTTDSKKQFENVSRINIIQPSAATRHFDDSPYPKILFVDEDPNHLPTILFDFESNVRNWENVITIRDSSYIWGIFQEYLSRAKPYYVGDPVGMSRMILICLKMIQVWDSLVVASFPLLKEHRHGIDLAFTDHLVLPDRITMHQLLELERYFQKRNYDAKYPSLIEESEIFTHSFSARYAKDDARMQAMKAQILQYSATQEAATLERVRARKLESEKLQTQIKSAQCEYNITEWRRVHSDKCRKCILVKREQKCVVQRYERPLPNNEECQNAVLFELMIPDPIGTLRDLLYLFGASVTCNINNLEKELYGPWVFNESLSRYRLQSKEFLVTLMSSKKLFTETHYRNLHATNPESDFIVPNAFNLRIAGKHQQFQHILSSNYVKSQCTFRVAKKSPYANLQWAINGTEYTFNQVLAKQNECHRDLSLTEFVEFGSLRCAYSIQLRSLYRALTQLTLSLKTESVFNLFCQTLWQTGSNHVGTHLRDSHIDLNNDPFIFEFLRLMEQIRLKHANNWKDHYVLLTIITFVLRVISMSNHVQIVETGFLVLGRCRDAAKEWSKEIQKILSSNIDAPRAEIDALRMKMIEINVCAALTFSVAPHQYSHLKTPSILLSWLISNANIYDNCTLLGSGHVSLREVFRTFPKSLQNLLRRVCETGLSLEPFLHQTFAESSQVLTSFVETHYSASEFLKEVDRSSVVWGRYLTASNVYYCDLYSTFGRSSTMQMDIINGSFLVDGCPVSYLPSSIENHPEFQRVFPMRSFEVRPFPFQHGRFITRDKFQGSWYSFFLKEGNNIVITEHREGDAGETLELIPFKLLVGNIQHLLVEECTHWWNKKDKIIEIFKRDLSKSLKLYNNKPSYKMCLKLEKERFLMDLAYCPLSLGSAERKRLLVDVNCQACVRIVDIIKRLEHRKFVNMWYNVEGEKKEYIVELPRMGLHFVVTFRRGDRMPFLMSKEYRGMKVAPCQKLGTLVGLRNGLLLQDADFNNKAKMSSILLMPHGIPVIRGNNHVELQIQQLRTPSFFAYEVDDRFRQLKARESQTAWLFLAYLHAATSSPLPDPFTKVTGTERAFQILQSGHCWSCQPIEEECLRTLNDIAKLSPTRQYYPPNMKTMETVNWNVCTSADTKTGLDPQVAHDGFQIIVQKLIRDSERLSFLFPNSQDSSPVDPDSSMFDNKDVFALNEEELCIKAYWQRVGLSTKEGRISIEFDEEYDVQNAPTPNPVSYDLAFNISFTSEQMRKTLGISQLCHKSMYCPPGSPIKLVRNLLLSPEDLKGVYDGDYAGAQKMEDWRTWLDLNFRDSWLDLYNFARKVQDEDMEAEWMHLLTLLAFRDDNQVPIDHLLFLQTIATNPEYFDELNPPSHQEYFMTNEFVFDEPSIKDILKGAAVPWPDYMNEHAGEQKDYEDIEDFIERMRPVYEETIETQAQELTTELKELWPIDRCEKLELFCTVPPIPAVEYKAINFLDAIKDLNGLLRNWYNNLELHGFLEKVEKLVKSLKDNPTDKYCGFVDVGKKLHKNTEQKKLGQFCKKGLFTINLEELLEQRGSFQIDKSLLNKALELFNKENCSSSNSTSNNKIQASPAHSSVSECNNNLEPFPFQARRKCPILDTYITELKESWIECQKSLRDQNKARSYARASPYESWSTSLTKNRTKTNEMWEKIRYIVKPIGVECDNVTKGLISAEIFPRTSPLTLLPIICQKFKSPYLNYIKNLLGGYAVQLTIEQKAARCVRYSMKGKESFQVELEAEQANPGHENWNPSKRPHWLLFEIEMDLMVRGMQAKVAERMENPTADSNALLQLNMGEGKTAVIVPLLILSLANGKQLCRVTVLKSLYEINHKALISTLGGILLNRRVYAFPCRRDYNITQAEVRTMTKVYEECMAKGGVVMGLPEYRLSFQLKAYEKCGVENFIDGREFLTLQQWLERNARDVLDESDEILHVKYQLIYTIGKQLPVGGGSTRWVVLQKLLKLIPKHLRSLIKEHGNTTIEVIERSEPQAYPFCRLLKPNYTEELCRGLASDIIEGNSGILIPTVRSTKKGVVMDFLTNSLVDRATLNETFDLFPLSVHREILLILRGLLACGVVNTALSKRWRVNYGINPSGYRRVAVPFRAKDVAAERTEFGHPDIAIILTQLCYYYSGLSNAQLEQCFVHLLLQPDPAVEYDHWISLVPKDIEGIAGIQLLSGVNLKDYHQRTNILFPVLRTNTATIDFWLSKVVFPQESKQFAWKIGSSPWDLCSQTTLPTTGFSGTNDSKLLLPKTISQKDLPELQGTNGSVIKNLLKRENSNYEPLPADLNSKAILIKLKLQNIKVLLDVGALMLELNNEQVAQVWLELEDEDCVDAAIYFDQNNKLVVIDRSRKPPVSLELSTYRTRLDRCLIYLDDVHTRGTDLKIPQGCIGCVTLGKGVTKDKLVQGCMRMRKLGQGHTVVFWASCEVDNAIRSMLGGSKKVNIGSKEVLEWAIENSRLAIEDGFIHWANAGVYQAQKLSSHFLYTNSKQTDQDLKLLAESCSLKDTTDLKTMYGEVRSIQPFPTIVQFLLRRVKREMEKRLVRAGKELQHSVEVIVASFGETVVSHTTRYVSKIQRSSQTTDEEQERELEHELEAEQEKQLPPKYKAMEHSINVAVENFVLTGDLRGIESWAVKLPLVFYKTALWSLCKTDIWAQHIYATHDFKNVIKTEGKGDILRPPHWICCLRFSDMELHDQARHKERKAVLLLLSPFEANYFINYMRREQTKTTLHMFAPRISPEQKLLCNESRLILPFRPPSTKSSSSPQTTETDIIPLNMTANLLLFSGSSYFTTKAEQDEYCKVVGFCLQDRNEDEKAVFESGGIIDGFFVKPEFRSVLGLSHCQFKENPEALIREIIRLRYGNFSPESHVGKMILQCKKAFNEED